jgi:hypothetical protein
VQPRPMRAAMRTEQQKLIPVRFVCADRDRGYGGGGGYGALCSPGPCVQQCAPGSRS